jgi:hypothetical protein
VNYADKRVRHTSVVSLEERFQDLALRYGLSSASLERLQKLKDDMYRLETRIFRRLSIEPGDLEGFNTLSVFDLKTVPAGLNGDLRCP